ncbi:MAG: sensor histidine kinase [Chthoniobacteraceae bacterium]
MHRPRAFHLLVRLSLTLLLLLSAANRAWAAGGNPSTRFLVRPWQAEDGLPGSVVRSVALGKEGYLWVAAAEGLVRFDGVRFTTIEPASEAENPAPLSPRFLFPQPDGSMWVATATGGLLRWDGKRLVTLWSAPPGDGAATAATQVLSDGVGGTLVLHGEKVWRFKGADFSPVERTRELDALLREDREAWARRGRPGVGATSVQIRDQAGRFWMTTTTGALVVSDPDGYTETLTFLEEAGERRILELLEDGEGNIWAAAGESGLLQIRERRVQMINPAGKPGSQAAMALLEDRSGALWVGNRGGGIDRLLHGEVKHYDLAPGAVQRPIAALCEDPSATLWAATRDGSIFRLQDDAFRTFPNAAAAPSKVAAIVADRSGTVWFGGQQGLARREGEIFTAVSPVEEVGNVTALAPDDNGGVWIGTSAGALRRFVNGRLETIPLPATLSRRAISGLLPEDDGALWAATLGSGLLHVQAGKVTQFSSAEGLPDSRLTCILADAVGHLWFGSLGGVLRVKKQDLLDVIAGGKPRLSWLQLDRSDGLLSRECGGGFQPAGWRGRDGRLYFATVRGVASLQPDSVELNATVPPVVIEEVRANGESRAWSEEAVRIGPGRSRVVFRYTALTLAAAEKVKFRVLLEGLEQEWRDLGDQRTAAYEAVPPGRYRFRVIAANADGIWNEEGAALSLRVLPHWWETAAFRMAAAVLAIVAAVGAGWLIARARMRRRLAKLEVQRAREAERARIARDLHDDLGASLTEISLLASLAAEEARPDPGGRDSLGEIAGKAQVLVTALDEIVWAVNPRHDTVRSFVDYLAASIGESLEAARIALRLDIPRELPPIPLEAERRHSLFLAVREAVNNAVKHSGATEILLRVQAAESSLEVTVRDNGRGFPAAAGPADFSEGMRNLKSRLTALGGECEIESQEQRGTTVRLQMPLAAPHST